MIQDSEPWKRQLRRDATLLERWARETGPSESRSFRIERRVFLAAYAMRKLAESLKVSTALLEKPIQVCRVEGIHPGSRDRNTHYFGLHNTHSFARHFDLKRPIHDEMPRRRLINMIIHSIVYIELVSEAERYEGFYITSGREQRNGAYLVELSHYTALIRELARDYPSVVQHVFDPKRREWIAWSGHGDPPQEIQRLSGPLVEPGQIMGDSGNSTKER